LLHRAFSIFLYNSKDELLLQQRASSKKTFPNHWTNSCCSHPLYGFSPPEEDGIEGIRRAAARKLQNELGISLLPQDFQFVSRIEYCAADPNPPTDDVTAAVDTREGVELSAPRNDAWRWGEHELDYILFCRTDLVPGPNPEEVQAVKYVSQAQLYDMIENSGDLLWSPWFRLVAKSLLPTWWKDVDRLLSHGGGGEADSPDKIYRF